MVGSAAKIDHAPQHRVKAWEFAETPQDFAGAVQHLVLPKWLATKSRREDGMHLSTHNWMRAEPLETTLKRIAGLGYESIEISGEPTQYDTREVQRLLKRHDIRCWGAVTLTLGERNLAARDERQRAATVQYMKDVLTMVNELEGEIITLVPATVGKITPDGSPEEEWQWLVEGCREVHAFAREKHVRVGIEPLNRFETHILNRADQALALAEAVAP